MRRCMVGAVGFLVATGGWLVVTASPAAATTTATLHVNAPAAIAGGYATTSAEWSVHPASVTADVVEVDDGSTDGGGTVHDGCQGSFNDVAGKIALITRGGCTFVTKAVHASERGAAGVIISNNVSGLVGIAPSTISVPIPVVGVSLETGDTLRAALLTETVNVTIETFDALSATKTAELVNDVAPAGVTPGDTLRYTIDVTNSGTSAAIELKVLDSPDPSTALVVGSVTTTQGSVTSGNGAGDTDVAVDVGTLSNATVSVTFDVTIPAPFPVDKTSVSNQAEIQHGANEVLSSDDPSTVAPLDPTVTPVATPPPVPVEQPDMQVKANNIWLGQNVYNATAAGQTRNTNAKRQVTKLFEFRVQNDGTVPSSFVLGGTGGTGQWIVRYKVGSTNVTSAVVAGTYVTPVLAPGATFKVTLTVKPTLSAPIGAVRATDLTAIDGTLRDTARASVKVVAG